MRTIRTITLFILLLTCATRSFASVEFVSSEIDTGDNRQGYWAADMNGDLLGDILIAVWSESGGRELLIYTQEENGKFSNSPWRRIEIKKDIIAFALADLRPEPGSELLFFTASACYSLSCAVQGYANNLRKLFDWELIKSIPDKKKIDFVGVLEDLNDDGYVDLLLPGQKQYALFRGQGGENFSKALYLSAADMDINAGRRNSTATPMDVINGPDIYSNLLVHRLQTRSVTKIVYPPILNYTNWIPSVSTGRFNSDELDDFIYLDDMQTETKDTKRVNLIYQSKTGEFPAVPHWQGTVGTDDNVKMMDFNGDGLTDLFTIRMKGLDNTLSIFLNLGGRFKLNKPDHIMKLKGQLSDFQAIDINRDGSPELVMNSFLSSPIKEALSGNVERKLLIFAGGKTEIEGSLFGRKPAFVYKEKIDADNFKSLMGKRSLSDDIDGDGINDVVSVDNTGALVVNRINHDLKLDTEPILRFAPMHFIMNDKLVKLNQDGRTDIILEHRHGLSLIISQQGARP